MPKSPQRAALAAWVFFGIGGLLFLIAAAIAVVSGLWIVAVNIVLGVINLVIGRRFLVHSSRRE